MTKFLCLVYGSLCYLLFLVTFLALLAFVGDLLPFKTIDSGYSGSIFTAVIIDVALLVSFGLQHSIMARPGFKRVWTKLVPQPIERSTYVLISCLWLIAIMWLWRPVDIVIWDVQTFWARASIWSVFVGGWLLVPVVTFMLDHFELFGAKQVWAYAKRRKIASPEFRTPLLYRFVRHPLYVGWTIAFFATPKMTVGHLLFAAILLGYMALATVFEERDLIAAFGSRYQAYQRRVPRLVPRFTPVRSFGDAADDQPSPNEPRSKVEFEVCQAQA